MGGDIFTVSSHQILEENIVVIVQQGLSRYLAQNHFDLSHSFFNHAAFDVG